LVQHGVEAEFTTNFLGGNEAIILATIDEENGVVKRAGGRPERKAGDVEDDVE
jgi:hypothetical protein